MKQGMKSIENLYGELMRQREARMDLIANTRSLSVSTENGISTLSIFTDKDIYNFKVTDIAGSYNGHGDVGNAGIKMQFNAANYEPIYGASQTVQPPSFSLLPQIKY